MFFGKQLRSLLPARKRKNCPGKVILAAYSSDWKWLVLALFTKIEVKGVGGGSGGGCTKCAPRRMVCGCEEGLCHGLAASRQKVQSITALAEELSHIVHLSPSPSEAWHNGEITGMCVREKVFNG